MNRPPRKRVEVCYLCGKRISGDNSNDHVPPRHFYSKEIRRKHGPNLFTLPTHLTCNRDYQLDEEYFVHSITPLTLNTYSGKSIVKELLNQYGNKRNWKLGNQIIAEFEERPSGIHLPQGKVVKRINPDRIWRVVWKIVRGLFYKEYGKVLPEDIPKRFWVVSPGEKPPEIFSLLPDEPARGQYPGVFDYKFRIFPESTNAHLWSFLLWDKIIMLILFHDPDCNCENCNKT